MCDESRMHGVNGGKSWRLYQRFTYPYLLVYSALEYTIRKRLKETDTFAYDQLKKPTQNPTARWIFETFYEIQYVTIPQLSQRILANMREENIRILNVLGERYWDFYNRDKINS